MTEIESAKSKAQTHNIKAAKTTTRHNSSYQYSCRVTLIKIIKLIKPIITLTKG